MSAKNSHLGDPCIHCSKSLEEIQPGECAAAAGLAAHTRTKAYWQKLLAKHEADVERDRKRLSALIREESVTLALLASGFDEEKIALAEGVLRVYGKYAKAGEERDSVIKDAIAWLSGESVGYRGLAKEYFGTKDYDRWHGQRSDHAYGYGPSHGCIIFSVGLLPSARAGVLSEAQKDAAIYYLMNIQAIQECASAKEIGGPA